MLIVSRPSLQLILLCFRHEVQQTFPSPCDIFVRYRSLDRFVVFDLLQYSSDQGGRNPKNALYNWSGWVAIVDVTNVAIAGDTSWLAQIHSRKPLHDTDAL